MRHSFVGGRAAAIVVAGLVAGLLPGGAQAAAPAVSSEAASGLTGVLDTGLRQWLPSTGGKAGWHWTGRPLVTPAGDHYDVDLPALSITSEDGSGVQAGVIRLTLTPQADESWLVGATMPGRFTTLGNDGKTDGEITIASQRFTGRWLPSLGTFVTMDGALGGIHAVSGKDSARLDVANLALKTDLTEQPAGRWSGPGTLSASGFVMVDEHGAEIARIGGLVIDSAITSLDLVKLVKIGTTGDAAHHPELLRGLAAGFSSKLTVTDTTMSAANDGSSFTLKEMSTNGGLEGLDGEQSSFTLGYRHDGLSLKPSPGPSEFTPEKAELHIVVSSLPNAGLWSAAEKLLKPPPGQTEEQASSHFADAVMKVVAQAGTRIEIKALSLDTPAAAATIKGSATFDGKAAFGAVGTMEVVVRGLDATLKAMQPAPGKKADEETQKTLATLAVAQALGSPAKDAAGRDLRTYKFEVTTDARVLLNGADMSQVLQSLQGPPGGKP